MTALVLHIPAAMTAAPLPNWCLNSASQPWRAFGAQRPLQPDFVDPVSRPPILRVKRFRSRMPGVLARGFQALRFGIARPFQVTRYQQELSQLIEAAQHEERATQVAIQSAFHYLKRNAIEPATAALLEAEQKARDEAAIWRQAGVILNAAKATLEFSYNAWRLGQSERALAGTQLSLRSYLCWPPHEPDLQQRGSYASLLETSADLLFLAGGPSHRAAETYGRAHDHFSTMNDGTYLFESARPLIEAAKDRTRSKRDLVRSTVLA